MFAGVTFKYCKVHTIILNTKCKQDYDIYFKHSQDMTQNKLVPKNSKMELKSNRFYFKL